MSELDLESQNQRLADASSEEILAWAWDTFGSKAAASSSFQTQSVPLLKIISEVCPELPVVFLDTGFHFLDTLSYRDMLQERFGLNIVTARAVMDKKELFARYGKAPYSTNPDLCCYINKVEPMRRAMEGYEGMVSGVRRDQTKQRSGLRTLEREPNVAI